MVRRLETIIVIDRGRIVELGPAADVRVPEGADVRDLRPDRASRSRDAPRTSRLRRRARQLQFHAQSFSAPRLFLAFGVTTVRIAGTPGDPYVEFNLKHCIEIVVSNGQMYDPSVLLAEVKGRFGWR